MNFISLDVETANSDRGSICQIGAARFENGVIVDEFMTYVDPEDHFEFHNIAVHGIQPAMVKGSPNFAGISGALRTFLDGAIVVSHTHFDKVAIESAAQRHQVDPPACQWLDSAKVARRAWSRFAVRGYGLANLCQHIGYEFRHHDALEDAKAAGHVLLAAIAESNCPVEEWVVRTRSSSSARKSPPSAITRVGVPDGPLSGEVIVFTGEMALTREQAADRVAALGAAVAPSVNALTTLLIIGEHGRWRLPGAAFSPAKTGKHRKAEQLRNAGYPIRILTESELETLLEVAVSYQFH